MATTGFCAFSTTDFLDVVDPQLDSGGTSLPAYLQVSRAANMRKTCEIRLADVDGEGFTIDEQPFTCEMGGVAEGYDPGIFTLWYGLVWDQNGTLGSGREDDFPVMAVQGGPVAELWNGWQLDLEWYSLSYGCM